jgi:diguanylate cyclase (GGDEF)-like protein
MGVGAGLLSLAVVAIALTVMGLRSDAADDAADDSSNIATVLAGQISHSVQSVDLVISEIVERITANPAETSDMFRKQTEGRLTFHYLVDRLERLPQASVVTIIDSTGKLWNTTRRWPRPNVDLSDRDYFRQALAQRSPKLIIGGPQQNRVTGTWTMCFGRRVETPAGEFLGMVIIGVETQYFHQIYDSIRSNAGRQFTLLRDDGTILIRHPGNDETPSQKLPADSSWYALLAAGGGSFRSPGHFGDEPRFTAVQPLRDYPLVLNVGQSEQVAFATWRRRAILIGIGTLVIVVCCAFLLKALTDQFQRLARSEAALAEREIRLAEKSDELEHVNLHLDAALNNITQGLCMFDAKTRIVVVNQRYIDMYGLSREIVKPGCTLRKLIEHRKDAGLLRGDPAQYSDSILTAIREGRTSTQLIETTDGRIIYVVQQPMGDGGWVVTHDDVTERRRAEEHMAYMARHDALTGLANRMMLLERTEEALARLRRSQTAFTLFVFDLDLFKAVNDSLGHPVGDALLKAVAQRLRLCTREVDTVARLGGDEFALLQAVEGDQRESAIVLASRLLDTISAPYDVDGHKIIIGTSIGIVLAPDDGSDVDQLMKHADLALYRAKSEGRNGYRLFEPSMDAEARSRHALQADLRNAVERNQFELHYQTVFDIDARKPCAAEALVRWRHPQRGLIQPGEFIQLAEEIGMIVPLGEWIVRQACKEAAAWPAEIKVAVNLSPAQFRNCNLIEIVAGALVDSGLPPERLELEITESVLLQKNVNNLSALHQLKSLGVSIVLDDFGTGYSSLSYLRMFPFDKIKIDRSFVGELSNRADCAAIVCAITGLGRGLGIVTTAEGVETEEQLGLLRAAGVDQVQGFLLGRPRPVTELNLSSSALGGRAA